MRKLVLFMHISLDGFAADPNHGLDFLSYDKELQEYADELVKTVGSPVYGRTTYQLMESYWPTVLNKPDADKHSLAHAQWVENVPKIVFSRTLKEATWNNTRLIKDNIAEEGSGISVFTNNTAKSTLKLLDSKTLKSGVVTLHYATT